MSEPKSIPHVTTTPKPFGVNVEWKWPDAPHQCIQLELQYLHEDGRLVKEVISWPVTEFMISGLKAGERLQVRLRPIAEDGSARDWRAGDWIEGVSSVDAAEMVQALQDDIRSNAMFDALSCDGGISPEEMWDAMEHIKRTRQTKAFGKSLAELSPFTMKNGQVFIKDAVIGNGIVSANYSVTLNVTGKGKPHAAGMAVGVEGDQSKVVFEADRFKVHDVVQSIVGNAVATNAKTKIRLCDEMKQAVIDAVRESDLFASLQAGINAQTASEAGLKQALNEAVKDVLRNALKPGGLLYKR
ncbi:gp24 [Enterobacter roggenkampii]|uniref:phage tail tip fiber protein n=1 Tax=Enterobacter roggenkampii TaxID=1812935 RepID=UPI00079A8018|nr:DUF1983 domain-containing protein [Enterobacter roggenkampii]CZZ86495.1 gp24 [Enterobacter roggenkampii]